MIPNLITGRRTPSDAELLRRAQGTAATTPTPPKRHGNKTEAAFADLLTLRIRAGEIQWWRFEAVKLRLADTTFYTPDFMALENDGSVTFYEVKGFWRDDARVKFKVAAALYPCFRFVAVTRKKGQWQYEWAKRGVSPGGSGE